MRHSRSIPFLYFLAVALSGCATTPGQFTPLTTAMPDISSLDHGTNSPEIEVMWTCAAPGPLGTAVTGVVRSRGPREVHAVGLEAQSVQSTSFAMQETVRAVPPIELYAETHAPFRIDVPLKAAGDRIDLLLVYAVTPAPWAPTRTEPEQHLAITDACAHDQHVRVATR